MNYKKLYQKIIDNRKVNSITGYTEKHHIIPKSLGGTNDQDNLVRLTAREHFICHYLLAKMYPKESFEWYKMNNAFLMMKCDSLQRNTRYFNSRLYEALRINFSSVMSKSQAGKHNSQYGTMWISNITVKENKKIPKLDPIPEGWVKGRNKWNIKYATCKSCGEQFIVTHNTRSYCKSESCKNTYRNNIIKDNFDEIKQLFEKYGSLYPALKELNIGYTKSVYRRFFELYN